MGSMVGAAAGLVLSWAAAGTGTIVGTASAAGLGVIIPAAAAGVFTGVGAAVDADGVSGSWPGLIIMCRLKEEPSLDIGDSRRWDSPYSRSK